MPRLSGILALVAVHQSGTMLRHRLFLEGVESLALQLNPEPSRHLEVGHHRHPFVQQPAIHMHYSCVSC